jgi:hypothetical protein
MLRRLALKLLLLLDHPVVRHCLGVGIRQDLIMDLV